MEMCVRLSAFIYFLYFVCTTSLRIHVTIRLVQSQAQFVSADLFGTFFLNTKEYQFVNTGKKNHQIGDSAPC